ncbi:hypothetical protein GN244_ATG12495 [Phytophthora infestans]|uniref:Uncharacterized protein n=1 Tax=Phytophthora infestans TaxID=4787 RepID=A0A833T888_PHYIN|nr:hypothetical protein GN244_ATG12495 [Phytophthora infestans]
MCDRDGSIDGILPQQMTVNLFSGIIWSGSDSSDSDWDPSIELTQDTDPPSSASEGAPNRLYTTVGVFEAFEEARAAMLDHGNSIYAYETLFYIEMTADK